jgi:hypothetical protein
MVSAVKHDVICVYCEASSSIIRNIGVQDICVSSGKRLAGIDNGFSASISN